MYVIAQIEKLDPDSGKPLTPTELAEVGAEGDTYESARDAVVIPDGWGLVAWVVPAHLPN